VCRGEPRQQFIEGTWGESLIRFSNKKKRSVFGWGDGRDKNKRKRRWRSGYLKGGEVAKKEGKGGY